MKCWFHLGMPKTGTTSIQETLYYELNDPGFVYCGFGEVNGSYAMAALVGLTPYFATLRSLPFGTGDGGRHRVRRLLGRCAERARTHGADLILSAEWCYGWGRSEHLRFGELAKDLGLDLHVVLYLRPPLDWMTSSLAQNLRYGQFSTHRDLQTSCSGESLQRPLAFSRRVELLRDLYGSERVTLRPFLRDQLAGGCVVQDFCRVVGMQEPPSVIHRRNERMSLPVAQCLHQRNTSLGRALRGPLEMLRRDGLVRRLERIFQHGATLRLHPSVMGDFAPSVMEELATLKRIHGVDLPLTTDASSAEGLDSLDRLLELDNANRRRLAEAVGADLPVPVMLERLERRSTISAVLRAGPAFVRRHLRHALAGS